MKMKLPLIFSNVSLWLSLPLWFWVPYCATAQTVSYPSGPNGCTYASGYQDPPFCTIPNETPLGSFVPPAPGASYTDANFGGRVTIATGPGFIHAYSSPSALSANNKYLAIREEWSGFSHISDPSTGRIVYPYVPFSTAGRFWDAYDDEVFYDVLGSQVIKYTLNTGASTTLVDYSGKDYGFTSIVTGGSTDTTKDNWMAFWAPAQHKVCALDLSNVRTYCADYTAPNPGSRVGWDYVDYALMSKGVDSTTGKRYVLLMGIPAMGVWSVNMQTGVLDYEFRGPENPDMTGNGDGICDPGENCLSTPHADTMAGPDGKQYLVQNKGRNNPSCELNMVTLDLSKGVNLWKPVSEGGGRTIGLTLAKCGDPWPDYHIGCAKSVAYCVLSTMTGELRSPFDLTSPIKPVPHRDELIVMRGNALDFTRIAMSRSVQYSTDDYWTQVRASLSNDGSLIVFDSNFGDPKPGTSRVAIANTGLTGMPLPPPVTVLVTPGGTLSAAQAQQFSAAVTGTSNTAVSWSLSPQVGSLSPTGLYLAPSSISSSQTVNVKATSVADPTKSATTTVTLKTSSSGTGVQIRVNAGGAAYIDPKGNVWAADMGFVGGGAVDTGSWVTGTTTPAIYGSVRYGDPTYTFTVPNGWYVVRLKFAEISGLVAGQRVFNVALNGKTVLPNFDIAAAAGGPGIAVDRAFPLNVSSRQITIQLSIVKWGSIISAIEIVPLLPGASL
jgi:hypothetical protein